MFLKESDITEDFLASYDYIIDACDTVSIKIMLIRMCTKLSKKLISCMGTANKVSPQLLEVVSLGNTTGDPLARVLRNILKKERKQNNVILHTRKSLAGRWWQIHLILT